MLQYTEEIYDKLHSVVLDLLLEIDRICRKHDIPYIVEGGTLLGAVRNKGFIPWDDDADIRMYRPDYNRFCEVCKKELDTEKYFLQNYFTDSGYRWGYGKLTRNNTSYQRSGQEMIPMKKQIFVDIFPVDFMPKGGIAKALYNHRCFVSRKIAYSVVGAEHCPRFFERQIYKLLRHIPRETIIKRFESQAKKWIGKDTDWVRLLGWGSKPETLGWPSEWLFERMEYEFEGYMIWGTKDYDGILRSLYGDYTQIPPKEKQLPESPADYLEFPDGSSYGVKNC